MVASMIPESPEALTAFYFAVLWFGHYLSDIISTQVFPHYRNYLPKKGKMTKMSVEETVSYRGKEQLNWNLYITTEVLCCWLTFIYLHAVYHLLLSPAAQALGAESHWSSTTWSSTHAISLHFAMCLYETCIYLLVGKDLVFYGHHVLTAVCCLSFLVTGRGHLWCCWLGLVEGTNPALNMLTILGQIPGQKGGALYVASGVSLWVTYVIFRMVSTPICFWYLTLDIRDFPEIAWISEDPTMNNAWLVLMWVSLFFIYGLSTLWFCKITKGLLKALVPAKKAAAPKETQSNGAKH